MWIARASDLASGCDGGTELRDCGMFEQAAQRQREAEIALNARHNLGGKQGVSAKFEEVGMNADTLDAQDFLPDCRNCLFRRVARRNVVFGRKQCRFRRGECQAIDLSVRRQRQAREGDEYSRNHVLRQALLQVSAKRSRGSVFSSFSNDVSYQAFVAGGVLTNNNYRLLHGGML